MEVVEPGVGECEDYTDLLPDEILAIILMHVIRTDPTATPSRISQRYRRVMQEYVRPDYARRFGLWPLYEARMIEPEEVKTHVRTMVRVGDMLQFHHDDRIDMDDGDEIDMSVPGELLGVAPDGTIYYRYENVFGQLRDGLSTEIGLENRVLSWAMVNNTIYALIRLEGHRLALERIDYDNSNTTTLKERSWVVPMPIFLARLLPGDVNDRLLVVEDQLVHIYTVLNVAARNMTIHADTYNNDILVSQTHYTVADAITIQHACVGTNSVIWLAVRYYVSNAVCLISWNLNRNVMKQQCVDMPNMDKWRSMVVARNWLVVAYKNRVRHEDRHNLERWFGDDEEVLAYVLEKFSREAPPNMMEIRTLETPETVSAEAYATIPTRFEVETMLPDVDGDVHVLTREGDVLKYKTRL